MEPVSPEDLIRLKNLSLLKTPTPPSSEEIPQEKPQENLQENLFDRVWGLVRTIFNTPEPNPQTPIKAILIDRDEAIDQVQAIIDMLDAERSTLLEEFTHSAEPFVKRLLDGELKEAQELLKRLKNGRAADQEGDWVQVVQDVDQILGLANPRVVRDRLSDSVHNHVREAVNRDLITLLGCQSDALDGIQDKVLRQEIITDFEQKLLPIFLRIEDLAETSPSSESMRDLFLWKQKVDLFRYALTERGLLTIDALLKSKGIARPEQLDIDEEGNVSYIDTRLQDLQDASQRFLIAFSTFSFDDECDDALFLIRQLREEVLQIDPHALVREDLKGLFDKILDAIMIAECLIRPSQNDQIP